MPTMNTFGNSRPFALCSVIIVTAPPSSSIASKSDTSATFSRYSASVGLSAFSSNSCTAPTNSRMFSTRLRFSSLSSLVYWLSRPAVSMTYCTSSVSFMVSAIIVRPIISSLNFSTLFRPRELMVSGMSMQAVKSGISCSAA